MTFAIGFAIGVILVIAYEYWRLAHLDTEPVRQNIYDSQGNLIFSDEQPLFLTKEDLCHQLPEILTICGAPDE